jgi:hypothetical protein
LAAIKAVANFKEGKTDLKQRLNLLECFEPKILKKEQQLLRKKKSSFTENKIRENQIGSL